MNFRKTVKFPLLALAALSTLTATAFQPIPRDSAKALGVTRSKPFSAGAVFIHGKYLEPPYKIERWGTGIRINSIQVTGQIVDWNDFLKTQSGVKVSKTETVVEAAPAVQPAAAPVVEPAQVEAVPAAEADASSLDDLFDDDPKPAKAKSKPARRPVAVAPRPVVAQPRSVISYTLEGDFVPNEASKALLKKINAARTDIDRCLRAGGFICFGDSYAQVTSDRRTLERMLDTLPELLQKSQDVNSFRTAVRSAGLVYLNEVLCEELFNNRLDYRKLRDLRTRLRKEQKWNQVLDEVSAPLI